MQKLLILLILPFLLIATPKEADQWKAWILSQKQTPTIPTLYNSKSTTVSQWFSPLQLSVNSQGGYFSFTVTTFGKEQWVILPGGTSWPISVRSQKGVTLPILAHNGKPALLLPTGTHTLKGKFQWDSLPKALTIPAPMSVIQVTLQGKKMHFPIRRGTQLVLKNSSQKPTQQKQRNTLQLKLFRKLDDGIPQIITSHLKLIVTGSTRDVDLGILLPAQSELISLTSPLPAVITKDGKLRTQIKPGTWSIILKSRVIGVQNNFTTSLSPVPWPQQEIWTFTKDETQRVVTLKGNQIDPSQTDMPHQWQNLPTFLLNKNDTLKLIEKSRGDQNPSPNSLSLNRIFHLDFNGGGFTIEDNLTGTISRPSELSMLPPIELGSASLNGMPSLIVKSKEGTSVGIPAGHISLTTTSRLTNPHTAIPATGWQTELNDLSVLLHLPPGWELFHATGPNHISGSIVSRWDLWDLFVLLIIVVLIFKNFGPLWTSIGIVSLIALFHQSGAPRLLWLNLLITLTVLKQLPLNRWREALRGYYMIILLFATMLLIPLSIKTLREVVYPQLQRNPQHISFPEVSNSPMSTLGMATDKEVFGKGGYTEDVDNVLEETVVQKRVARRALASSKAKHQEYEQEQRLQHYQVDENLQTGPGKPQWQWNSYSLSWSGPIDQSQKLQFFLLPPAFTRLRDLFAIIGFVALLIALLRTLKDIPAMKKETKKKKISRKKATPPALLLLILLGSLLTPKTIQAEYPPQYLMKTLEKQVDSLLAITPPCYPSCAEVSKGVLAPSKEGFTLSLSIYAQEVVAFPLLQQQKSFTVTAIQVNGKPRYTTRNNQLYALLKKGENKIILKAKTKSNQASLSFSTPLHNLSIKPSIWEITGVKNGQVMGNTIQMTKQEQRIQSQTKGTTIGEQSPATPFVRITRHLELGREQLILTTITRVAPQKTPLSISVELLKDEALLTEEITIKEGKALISLPANKRSFSFQSRLPQKHTITLKAHSSSSQVEQWSLRSDPRYRIVTQGLLPIKEQGAQEVQHWKPRSGDSLVITIEKPDAIPGKTTTIESAHVRSEAGDISTISTLSLMVTSSKGDPLTIVLPPQSKVESVIIEGRSQVLPDKSDTLQLILHPGSQSVTVSWKQKKPLSFMTKTPAISLSSEGANITLDYQISRSRWVVSLGGPLLGPAMLIWGILFFFIAIAMVLPKYLDTPLNRWQWLALFLGVSSVHYLGAIPLILWFATLAYRQKSGSSLDRLTFNFIQIVLIIVVLFAVLSLSASIPASLLSNPDMHITGNGSSAYHYVWYQDRSGETLPQGWILSFPLWGYRIVMLLWSVWIALQLPKWMKWSWKALSSGQFWMK